MKQQKELVYTDLVKAHMIMGLIDLLLVMTIWLNLLTNISKYSHS
jgi:hypothetical protein